MKYNLRDLLWHMKHKGLKDEAEKIAECKEHLYDAIEDNIDYFRNYKENHLIANPHMYYTVHISMFKGGLNGALTLDKLIEIKERFNKAATGLFGLQFDNSASIVLTDLFGHSFVSSCYYHDYNKTYELCVWDMTGCRRLCTICTKNPKLTKEQIQELEDCHNKLMEIYEEEKESHNRYQQICKYKDYIRKEDVRGGYAHYTCKVYVRNDIPISLSQHEIAKYADNWNYCFGGSIQKIGMTDTETVYSVKVHTG